MREIKFRAWLKTTKEMVQFEKINFTTPVWFSKDYPDNYFWGGGLRQFRLEASREGAENYNHDDFNKEPDEEWVLMQYTGLLDKNGKEIYEGDIITFIFPNNGNKGIAPVVWEYGCWNVTDFKNNAGSNNIYNLYPATDCEIIGNIYQNPELLTS